MIVGDMEIRLRADIARLQRDMNQARQVVGDTAAGIGRAADQMKAALAAVGLGAGLAQIIQMSDQYTKFTAQLKLATTSQREYAQALADVKRISTDAQSSMAGAGTLYARIANGTRELSVSQKQVADITETVSLALKVSGATAEESASAMLQLSQSFASGTLRGEEFNAVNEAAPRLMKALADGMGVPVGALKDMASNGLITSKIMADVLPRALMQLRDESKQVQTIGGAFQVLKDRVMEFTAAHAEANGTVAVLTAGISLLANNLDVLMGAIGTVTAAKIAVSLQAWATNAYNTAAASRALTAATLAGTVASTQAAATTAAARYSEAAATATATEATLGLATARVAELRSAIAAADGEVALALALNGLIPAEARAAAAAEAHAVSLTAVSAAGARVTTTSTAATAALGAQAAAAGLASRAMGVLNGIMGFFGGPIGLVITLLGAAVVAWQHYSSASKEESAKAAATVEESTTEMIARLDKEIEKLKERNALRAASPVAQNASDADADGLARAKKDLEDAQNATGRFAGRSEVGLALARKNLADSYATALARVSARQTEVAIAAKGTRDQQLTAWYAENGSAAQRMTAELDKLRKQFGTIPPEMEKLVQKKYEDKGSVAALNKEASAYETLISSIRSKTAENELELATGNDATESEKAAIKITEELASGKLKLSAAHQAALIAALAEQTISEKSLKLQAAQVDVTKFIVASTTARGESAKALDVEYAAYGKTADARDMEMVAVKSQADTQKKLDDLQAAKLPVTDQIIEQLKSEEAARTLVGQATLGQTKALQYAASLKTDNEKFAAESIADPKARADALLAIDDHTWKERIKLAGDGTEAQRLLQGEYNTWYANQQNKLTSEVDVSRATELLKIMEAVDDAARQAAQGMADSFGAVGKAVGDLTTALSGYQRAQATIAAQLAASMQDAKGDPTKVARVQAIAAQQGAQAQIKSYGDMASAAKGFFGENSKGYKVLETTEKAYRAVEMAMAVESFLEKTGLLASFTGLFAASKVAEAAATVATVPVTVTAEGVKQAALATTAMAGAVAVPFPGNLAAVGIVAGMLAAIGLSSGGGGGGKSVSQQRQDSQGTGSVLGDSSAKSESIARAIALTAQNSDIELSHTAGMLAALKSIDSNIAGLGSLIVRTTGITGGVAADTSSFSGSAIKTAGVAGGALGGAALGAYIGMGMAALGGPLGLALGTVIGGLVGGTFIGKALSSVFGGSTSVTDTGLTVAAASLGSINTNGVKANQYTDTKTDGGWFHSDKNNTVTTALGAQADDQFSKVITGIARSITAAAGLLGLGGDEFTKHLNSFVVDIGKISLKGLSGDEIQKQLEAAFSKLGDDMAQFGVAGLESFQQVGEGYLETLTRIATDYANLDSILAASSTTFGATGMASIAARERLIELAGGIDQLASQTNSFTQNFLSKAEQLAPVQKYVTDQLAGMGLQSLDTRDKFKDYVLGLASSGALATEAGAQQYTALLALADAFAKTHAATVDLTKSEQEIADERTDLQNKLDDLTMTQAQLAEKARNAIDSHNLALYDQVIAAQAAKDAAAAAAEAEATAAEAIKAAQASSAAALASFGDALADSMKKATEAAAAFRALNDALLIGDSSTLNPEQKYLEAKRQFDSADSSNLGAAEKAFLDASKAWFGGSAGYAADFQTVLDRNNAEAKAQDALAAAIPNLWAGIRNQMTGVDGSHAGGLDFVPFNGYRAELHYGERVQTAAAVRDGDAATERTNILLEEVLTELRADKAQRGAVGTATIEKIDKLADSMDAQKRATRAASREKESA